MNPEENKEENNEIRLTESQPPKESIIPIKDISSFNETIAFVV